MSTDNGRFVDRCVYQVFCLFGFLLTRQKPVTLRCVGFWFSSVIALARATRKIGGFGPQITGKQQYEDRSYRLSRLLNHELWQTLTRLPLDCVFTVLAAGHASPTIAGKRFSPRSPTPDHRRFPRL